MLNEKLEYLQYTYDKEKYSCERLKWKNISSHFAGISRPLEIISRKKVFDMDIHSKEDILKVKEELEGWKDGWITKYIESLNGIEKNTTACIKELKTTSYDGEMYSDLRKGNSNDLNATRYEKTIADALNRGPLKRYYLVGKESKTDENLDCGTRKKEGKGYEKRKNRVLKVTAAYLLAFGDREDGYKRLVNADIGNWFDAGSDLNAANMYDIKYNKEPLIEKYDIDKKINFLILRLNKNWLEDGNWRIVEESELVEYDDKGKPSEKPGVLKTGEVFYADFGTEFLQKNTLYPKDDMGIMDEYYSKKQNKPAE